MAITGSALTTGFSTTSGTGPYTTASVTPSANQPVMLAVLLSPASGVVSPVPTITGCGLTWTKVTQTAATSGTRTLFLFVGIGSSPTAGAVTISGDGTATFNSCIWQATQLAGVATSVANGVVQSVNAKPASATSVNVAFGSSITAGNATFAGVGVGTGSSPSAGTGWTSEGSTNAPSTGLLGEFAAAAQQNVKASWTGSAGSFVVGVEMAAASTSGTDATASGPVARVTVTAPAGSVTVSGGTVTLAGPAAVVRFAAPAGSVSIVNVTVAPPTTLTWPPPDWFVQAVRSSYGLSFTVDAFFSGTPVSGATGLRPVGGQVTDTTKAGVRRTLSVDLPGGKSVYDALAPTGTTLKVTANVVLSSQQVVLVPMGVFVVDQVSLDEATGKVSVTAPDRWVLVQRAKFVGPASSSAGLSVVQQITQLIQGALGSSEAVVDLSGSSAAVGALTWQRDRDKAVIDLATGAGLWVYADRSGTFTINSVPTISASAAWLVDASPSGVLVSLDRQKSRQSTFNVVVVDSSSASQSLFPTQYLWDSDPASPTFAGPAGDGVTPPAPELAGPFGLSPYLFSDPSIQDSGSAQGAGLAILSRTVGIASQVSLGQVPNPAVDAFDSIDVLPPGRVLGRRAAFGAQPALSWVLGADVTLERHVVDTVTHPLDPSQAVQIQGRSTRTDPYT